MRVFFFLFSAALLFASCDKKEASKVPNQPKPFSINGAQQKVVQSFPDGKVKTAIYIDTVTQSKVAEVEFHGNGQPKIHKRFVNDTLQGESWCYYENGTPWSLNTFENGINNGPYKTWHDNGQLYIQGQFEQGKKSGEWYTYFSNGQLNTRGFYKNDEKVGVWNSYSLEGKMKREQNFDEPPVK